MAPVPSSAPICEYFAGLSDPRRSNAQHYFIEGALGATAPIKQGVDVIHDLTQFAQVR